jgi:hypothetical protein
VEGPASHARTAGLSTPLRSARDDDHKDDANRLFSQRWTEIALLGRRSNVMRLLAKCQLLPANCSLQEFGEFSSCHLDLLAASQVLHCELIGTHFVLADDDDVLRARLFRQLERFF